jgi:hypothetical protein
MNFAILFPNHFYKLMPLLRFFFPLFLLLLCQLSAQAQKARKDLVRKWELVEIQLDKLRLGEQELRSKNGNTLIEFREDGSCLITPALKDAKAKVNRWRLAENDSKLIITAKEEQSAKNYNQKFNIEKLSGKLLIISTGEKSDREIYTYKAIR